MFWSHREDNPGDMAPLWTLNNESGAGKGKKNILTSREAHGKPCGAKPSAEVEQSPVGGGLCIKHGRKTRLGTLAVVTSQRVLCIPRRKHDVFLKA